MRRSSPADGTGIRRESGRGEACGAPLCGPSAPLPGRPLPGCRRSPPLSNEGLCSGPVARPGSARRGSRAALSDCVGRRPADRKATPFFCPPPAARPGKPKHGTHSPALRVVRPPSPPRHALPGPAAAGPPRRLNRPAARRRKGASARDVGTAGPIPERLRTHRRAARSTARDDRSPCLCGRGASCRGCRAAVLREPAFASASARCVASDRVCERSRSPWPAPLRQRLVVTSSLHCRAAGARQSAPAASAQAGRAL